MCQQLSGNEHILPCGGFPVRIPGWSLKEVVDELESGLSLGGGLKTMAEQRIIQAKVV